MNPALNILDQLLLPNGEGGHDLGQSTRPTESGEVNPFAVLLSELFGQAGTGIATNDIATNDQADNQASGQAACQDLLTALSGQAAPAQSLMAILQQVSEGSGQDVEQLLQTLSQPLDTVADNAANLAVDGKAADGSALLPTDETLALPQSMPLTNDSLRRLLQETPADLKTGEYTVESTKLVDDQITLSVRATDKSDRALKITLPAQILSDLNPPAASPRVSLDGVSKTEQRLQQLLADLNFKQLEISQGVESGATEVDPQKPVAVTLVAEENGNALQLKSRLMPHNIMAFENRAAAAGGHGNDKANAAVDNYQPQNDQNQTDCLVLRPAQPQSTPATPERNTSDFVSAATQARNETLIDPGQIESVAKGATATTDSDSKLQPRSVHFDLPDQLSQTLKPNGQSVMIRIQPDHLGPAQLRLTLHHNTMKATLTVDSHEAKALIEGSLDKLSQQLQKADIKFDQITVNVGSDDLRDQLFNRHPDWSRRPQFINEKFDPQASATTEIPATMPIFEQARVTSTGVNVLA